MPKRITPLVTGEIYHIYNQGLDKRPTFTNAREYTRALETIKFYQYNTDLKLSLFLKLPGDEREKFISSYLKKENKHILILSFCLMPNHFHFLVQQAIENGISHFASDFQNSYTKYFNTKHERKGSLFLDQFKAVRIETDDQLVHVSRYIKLNPYSSYLVKTLPEVVNYPWSSFKEYINPLPLDISEKDLVLSFFKTPHGYQNFILDNASYQRDLEKIKHLTLEEE